MADFFSDTFDAITGQQVQPQQTIIPTSDLFAQTGGILSGQVAPAELAYNRALAPGLTDIQLGVEQQINPGAFNLRRDALAARQRDLNLGYSLPPELQDLVTTNALQQLGTSGVGASDLGKLFGARSIAGAGLDRGEARIQNALAASQFSPQYQVRAPFGLEPGNTVAADISRVQAAKDDYANLAEDIRRQNFSALLNTGGRILGGVVGGVVGAYTGNVAGGVQAGQEIGGSLAKGSRVSGQQQKQNQAVSSGAQSIFNMFKGSEGGGNLGSVNNSGNTSTGSDVSTNYWQYAV